MPVSLAAGKRERGFGRHTRLLHRPGYGRVDTLMFRGLLGDRGIPADRIMRPQDIAEMIGEVVAGSLRYCLRERTDFARRRPM